MNTEENLVSVIVNVYNCEKYLEKCLTSIIYQSYKKLDIILIDDGSMDTSGLICDKFGESDQRIKVVHQNNNGLPYSRNIGLDIAKGNYITFVDCDDWIEENFISEMLNNISGNVEIAIALKNNVFESDRNENIIIDTSSVEIIENDKDKIQLITKRYKMWEMWGKLYKKKVFRNYRFSLGILFEDIQMIPLLLLEAKAVSFIPKQLYNYLHRKNSASYKKGTSMDIIVPATKTLNIIAANYSSEGYQECCIFYFTLLLQFSRKKESISQLPETKKFFMKHKLSPLFWKAWAEKSFEVFLFCYFTDFWFKRSNRLLKK
ncbi:Glycosyltransferase involved in cell wall bisynthesis [Anaerocolumna jejuensis DSM 15929]|uniref:Glycosyltransferase involved in cell wall bisynthesis n=1 Tax=Anaerocolumna jejuensis DSM 15929 TaxID=1121322 RepID=A0A1M7DM46_9FIRM|nr:glycosyltransferase [Anaerocolumna jejuensis]SHL80478.1 Glycosyltransferase involved in cell wall bisynthesis [Anaerocolumna jejuensis DSM 15929]